ncbi:DUF2867 domain-containing protein [Paracoccus tegillarcae]|uniref:DUF2867 domain-containing protein n=1 Tax=Paracoccus tegillarcae TaxID=1529068 RepID=A0A2K9ESD6_9RHOB|nr:DUF2867 domain-containing protein [Paracoccus tegillarcae]AUH34625.1 DUF2867 domain-containing protein [Paracoccus tegillarcae]
MTDHATTTTPPENSAIWSHYREGDFVDCYVTKADCSPREAAEILTRFPWWVSSLMSLRNLLVRPLGLRTSQESRDSIGFFPVAEENDDEILLGFDDRHLNFRLFVQSRPGQVLVGTWVHRNNWLGRTYLRLVMPFHRLILRNATRRLAAVSS